MCKAYCDYFQPETNALLAEAFFLAWRTQRNVDLCSSFLWAFLRARDRGEIETDLFDGVTAAMFEKEAIENDLSLGSVNVVSPHDLDGRIDQRFLAIFPPLSVPPEPQIDWKRPIGPRELLMAIMSLCDFAYICNVPLWRAGLEPELIYRRLESEPIYCSAKLKERGTIPSDRADLYQLACKAAASVGSWVLRDIHFVGVSLAYGVPATELDAELVERWYHRKANILGAENRKVGSCYLPIWDFPGRRPWVPLVWPLIGISDELTQDIISELQLAKR